MKGRLLIVSTLPPTVAAQPVNVNSEKSARFLKTLFILGRSTIHSAESIEEAYTTLSWYDCPPVESWISNNHVLVDGSESDMEAVIRSPGDTPNEPIVISVLGNSSYHAE